MWIFLFLRFLKPLKMVERKKKSMGFYKVFHAAEKHCTFLQVLCGFWTLKNSSIWVSKICSLELGPGLGLANCMGFLGLDCFWIAYSILDAMAHAFVQMDDSTSLHILQVLWPTAKKGKRDRSLQRKFHFYLNLTAWECRFYKPDGTH